MERYLETEAALLIFMLELASIIIVYLWRYYVSSQKELFCKKRCSEVCFCLEIQGVTENKTWAERKIAVPVESRDKVTKLVILFASRDDGSALYNLSQTYRQVMMICGEYECIIIKWCQNHMMSTKNVILSMSLVLMLGPMTCLKQYFIVCLPS